MMVSGDNTLTAYYISNSGNINNDGLSEATPKTLAGFSSFDLTKRCTVFFKRGETYNTAFTISNKNVSFRAYGIGAKPIFIGSTDISGLTWTDEGDGTFSANLAEPDMIYINGACAKLGETPWITITSYPNTNQFGINNADVVAYGSINGARLAWKPRSWTTEYVYTVTNYASSIITLNTATTTQTSVGGTTLKLMGKKAFLGADGEWAFGGGKVYIKSTVSPSTMNIRAANNRIGIAIASGAHGFECREIEFQDYYYSDIQRSHADNVVVDSCRFKNSNGYAFSTIGNANFITFTNNVISGCNGGYYDIATRISTIKYNTIFDIGMMGNVGSMPDYNCVIAPNKGIFMRDLNSTGFLHYSSEISYNTVYNTAATGIHFQGNSHVHHNIVYNFMQLFTDGGGIYCYATAGYTNIGSEVNNNIVHNGGADFSAGIYVDNRSISFNVHDNVVYEIEGAGLYANWDKQLTSFRNNIIVGCSNQMRYQQGGTYTSYQYNEGNVSTGNIMVCRSNTQFCHRAEVSDATVNYNPFNGGSSNNNYYISPYIGRVGYHTDDNSMSFSELKIRYSSDANSVTRNNYKTYVDHAQSLIDVLLLTNETDTDVIQAIGSGYTDVDGNVITQATVPAYGGFVALKS